MGELSHFTSPDSRCLELENARPTEILEWANNTVPRLALATSFQSTGLVILHMVRQMRPDIPVLFLDTGFHFTQTIEFAERIVNMWDLNLVRIRGEHGTPERQSELYGDELYRRNPSLCCQINKVAPLQKELENHDGWVSGLRRDQSPMRKSTPIVRAQLLPSGKEVLKIHPLARWSKENVDSYLSQHKIPTHPLLESGFQSIGCSPCTRPVAAGEDERAGRWDGFDKTECGIHSFGSSTAETEPYVERAVTPAVAEGFSR